MHCENISIFVCMKKVPKKVFVVVGLLVLGVVILSALLLWKQSRPTKIQNKEGAKTENVSTTSTPEIAEKKPLSFTFDVETIQPLVDPRADSYSFYVMQDIIGVIALHPAERNGKTVASFKEWVDGLNGKIRVGEEIISVQRKKVATYDAITFVTTKDAEKGYNVMTEAFGQTLWLQSKISEESLKKFLEHLTGITKS